MKKWLFPAFALLGFTILSVMTGMISEHYQTEILTAVYQVQEGMTADWISLWPVILSISLTVIAFLFFVISSLYCALQAMRQVIVLPLEEDFGRWRIIFSAGLENDNVHG